MSRSPLRRPFLILLLAGLLGFGLVQPGASAHRSSHDRSSDDRSSERIPLPDGFRPEGITIGHRHTAYLGSLANGDIYRLNLRSGEGRVISDGAGSDHPSVGLKIDRRGRLFVSGGSGGDGRVIDSRTGHVLASYQFTTSETTFVNDVVLTRRMAWFTDSAQPQLYGLPLGRHGSLPDASEVVTLPLSGEWVQIPNANNANGIATTPGRKALLVVNGTANKLFRVNPTTGVATEVDLNGASVENGDGLLRKGRTLYVVRNRVNQVAVFRLNRAGTEARLRDTLTSPDFDVPTTVARRGDSLYLPNARFGTVPNADTAEYWVTRIHR
jgi:sugar lactone lactonase YvrE